MYYIRINADDFGMSQEVNEAIAEGFKKGIIQTTSLMVNMPYANEAVRMAKEGGFSDAIGLHLNLVEGPPITQDIKKTKFVDEHGNFNGKLMMGINRLLLGKRERQAVKKEIGAQIERYSAYNLRINHIDSHRHVHTNYPVLMMVLRMMERIAGCSIRLSLNISNKKVSGLKRIYKAIINRRIGEYNRMHCENSIDFFTTFDIYNRFINENSLKRNGNVRIELEVHPILEKGVIVDASSRKPIEQDINAFLNRQDVVAECINAVCDEKNKGSFRK